MDETTIEQAARAWGIEGATLCNKEVPAGSPERSLGRWVVEGKEGTRFLLERIDPATAPRKREMAGFMGALAKAGLSVAAPCATQAGDFLSTHAGNLWQLTPFVQGLPLDRPGYTQEAWRGEVLAGFLTDLRTASVPLAPSFPGAAFDLPGYIDTLTATIQARRPKVSSALDEAVRYLSHRLYPHWSGLTTALAHGDVHGVNILWKEKGIEAVIDWEFFGHKPLLYDVANMVGCCGMETPDALLHGLVPALVRALRQADFADAASWNLLPECVMALRFAWLSEWLRKDDAEMINLELSYIYLLMDNREKLVASWGI
ncbi:phosphotransferase enzyme family protein [Desulfoluna butyratoxydans]|uniref:Aminoglycoside phosphotransferase n=1 Tax=Desulfoluna butyratoxydans TaxID=231438 RepID=A0A4U8YSQ2_9BACT|nr:phosphotransferase [Desulfoluna butyratoxydans]VFQ47416.1 aminoglycoside phosphotransferase [Desulfoluna butyratoxydans]